MTSETFGAVLSTGEYVTSKAVSEVLRQMMDASTLSSTPLLETYEKMLARRHKEIRSEGEPVEFMYDDL